MNLCVLSYSRAFRDTCLSVNLVVFFGFISGDLYPEILLDLTDTQDLPLENTQLFQLGDHCILSS